MGWGGAFALVRVPTASPIDVIVATDHELAMSAPREITTLIDGVMHVTSIQAGTVVYIDTRRAVVRSDRNELSMIDLHSGFSFGFSNRSVVENVYASHDRVAAITDISSTGATLSIWHVGVPEIRSRSRRGSARSPTQPIGNSEMYTWP